MHFLMELPVDVVVVDLPQTPDDDLSSARAAPGRPTT